MEDCKTCNHFNVADSAPIENQHCYMFMDPPGDRCAQHSRYKEQRKKFKAEMIPLIVAEHLVKEELKKL